MTTFTLETGQELAAFKGGEAYALCIGGPLGGSVVSRKGLRFSHPQRTTIPSYYAERPPSHRLRPVTYGRFDSGPFWIWAPVGLMAQQLFVPDPSKLSEYYGRPHPLDVAMAGGCQKLQPWEVRECLEILVAEIVDLTYGDMMASPLWADPVSAGAHIQLAEWRGRQGFVLQRLKGLPGGEGFD
jgi:hypothetical protein